MGAGAARVESPDKKKKMSGIAATYNFDGRPVDRALLNRMTQAIAHRGSDGVGHWIDGPVGLGHRQLCTTPESLQGR